uniref:Putative ggy family antimicrobial peptide n=1 Tax=Culex tarsalis TaxID=7177 RepID=A0A1Q3FV44_CULTA
MASFKVTILFAVVALFALVSAIPAPQQPGAARQPIAPRPAGAAPGAGSAADDLEAGSEDKDLQGASSYGYGYYGGYPGYYGGYPYAYSYGWGREFEPCSRSMVVFKTLPFLSYRLPLRIPLWRTVRRILVLSDHTTHDFQPRPSHLPACPFLPSHT